MKRILALAGMLLVFGTSAAQVMPLGMSGYHCPNSTCQAYLFETGSFAGPCAKGGCGKNAFKYTCQYCGGSYNICSSGHLYYN